MDHYTKALLTACAMCAAGAGAAPTPWAVDASYGIGGTSRISSGSGESQSLVASTADAQGRTVAVGTIDRAGDRDLVVMRFDAFGTPDPSFGIDGALAYDSGSREESAMSVLVQGDGRILIGGERDGSIFLMRLAADGSPDPTFGERGRFAPTFLSGRATRLVDLALDPKDRIVALATLVGAGGRQVVNPLVIRLLPDGALDRAFDADGVRVVREIEGLGAALTLGADSRIVLVANHGTGYALAALTDPGGLDGGFGVGGVVHHELGAGAIATDLVEHRGALLVSGLNVAALLRLTLDGARDGVAPVAGVEIGAWSMRPLADGTLIVAGACRGVGGEGWMLGRLDAAGTWSVDHCAAPAPGFAALRGVTGDATRLLAVGTASSAAGVTATVLRFTPRVAPVASIKPDKRCKKKKFRRKHPALCGG